MKKIIFTFCFVIASFVTGFSQITWMGNEYTTLGTQYLGDQVLFEIQSYPQAPNQGAQVYIDWNNDGYGSTSGVDLFHLAWISAVGNNSKWNCSVRMTTVGTHNRKYLGWQSGNSDYVTANMGTFVVTELNNPTATTPFLVSSSSVDLVWSKDAQSHNVMIVRKLSTDSWTEPTQGVVYTAGNSIGSGTVVYNGSSTTFSNNALSASVVYDYKFYSNNNNYYSAGVSASVTTATTSATDYFRSKASGSWNVAATWESSSNNSTWLTSTLVPDASATATTILTDHTVSIDENAAASALILNAGGNLTLISGKTLTTTNFSINSDLSHGTGSFVDLNVDGGLTVSGATQVNQYLVTGRNWYVSSPVLSATRSVITNASGVSSFNENIPTDGTWTTELPATVLKPLKGYVATVTSSANVTFTGTLNSGTLSDASLTATAGTYKGFNLVGNPYPSYVNWEMAAKTNLESSIWYRTKNDASTPVYVFDTYNATSHVGTSNNNSTSTQVTRYIAPMQAVWVRVMGTGTSGTLGFSNNMRTHQDQSLSTNRLKTKAISDQQVLRLKVSNGVNSDESIVLFSANALDGYDAFDSPKMSNENEAIPEIYTKAGSEKLVINGLKNLGVNQELALGFKTGLSNSFTIKATEISNFSADTKIIFKDKLLNTEMELTPTSNYRFTSDVASTDARFSILFRSASGITGFEANATDKMNANVYVNATGNIVVQRNDATKGMLIVSNALGQQLVNLTINEATVVLDRQFGAGVYFVTLKVEGKTTTQKIILN